MFLIIINFFSVQIVCYPDHNPLDRMSNYNQSNLQRSSSLFKSSSGRGSHSSPSSLEQLKVPYIPQPDYTPATSRRAESFRVQQTTNSSKQRPVSLAPTIQPLPRLDDKRSPTIHRPVSSLLTGPVLTPPAEELSPSVRSPGERAWHHPQWYNSSQFPAHDWNAALMKRLSVEAQTRREEKIRRQANTELDRFESEIDSYLVEEADEEEDHDKIKRTTSSGASTPKSSSTLTASPRSGSPSAGASSGREGHARKSRAQRYDNSPSI